MIAAVQHARRIARAGACAVALAAVAACASTATPPGPDDPKPPAPSLVGASVMLLPVQPVAGRVPDRLDAELDYWLHQAAPRVHWVGPSELEEMLARTPMLDVRLRRLAVSRFFQARVRRIADPLFGQLRRLAAVMDARFALVPVGASYVSGSDGGGHVEIAAALIDTIGGHVLWYGVVAGESGPRGNPRVVATAASTLAHTLFPTK